MADANKAVVDVLDDPYQLRRIIYGLVSNHQLIYSHREAVRWIVAECSAIDRNVAIRRDGLNGN